MMKFHWLLAVAALVSGCKGKTEPAPEAKPGSAVAASTNSDVANAAGAGSGTAAAPTPAGGTDPRCTTPCLFLDQNPLATVDAAFEKACGAKWAAAADSDCEQLDYQRNCIFAANGYTFKKKKWNKAFASLPWYKARADFKDKDLSPTATANIAELKQRAKSCKAGTIAAADKQLVDAWLAKLAAGTPEVPELVFDGTTQVPAGDARTGLIQNKDGLKTVATFTDVPSDATKAALPGKKLHAVNLSGTSGANAADCGDGEECESGTSYNLVFDETGKLVAIEEQFSACPMVYSMTGTPVLEGEILRNLDSPSVERTQTLAIKTAQCAGTARYRIAEEKDEVTSLDSLALVVDGVELAPDVCATGHAALCDDDGISQHLVRGEHLDVTFSIPAGARCEHVQLRANGHYVPNH